MRRVCTLSARSSRRRLALTGVEAPRAHSICKSSTEAVYSTASAIIKQRICTVVISKKITEYVQCLVLVSPHRNKKCSPHSCCNARTEHVGLAAQLKRYVS